ncbi:MAG TPA: glycosyltransferase family 2 protein [Candidatus Tumulicola sp.]|nr:glycosyltransferase family 2 protein [Candidatus Tumulicola sp.]
MTTAYAPGVPAASEKTRTTVSVVVPMFNEAPLLEKNLTALDAVLQRCDRYAFDYVLIDDGSSDGTHRIASAFARGRGDVRIVRHDRNRGLGAALRTARAHVTGDYVLTIDADLSYAPESFPGLVDAAIAGEADIALASAYCKGGKVRNVPLMRAVLSREANRFLSMALNGKIATATCVVRAYRRETFTGLRSCATGMDVNAVLLMEAVRNGARVVELPAVLDWGEARPAPRGSVRSICELTWRTMRCGFGHRPALLLAIPGLIPGLLPLVVAVLYLLHFNAPAIAFWSLVTVVVQYSSLALFAGQTITFIHRRRSLGRLAPRRLAVTKE